MFIVLEILGDGHVRGTAWARETRYDACTGKESIVTTKVAEMELRLWESQ